MAAPTRLVDVVSALAVALALGTGCPGRDRPGDDDDDDPAIDAGPSDAGINDAGIEPDAGFAFDAGPIPAGTRVRVVAGNLTTGNFEAWDLGHGARILQGLAPDVALLQELNVGDGSDAALRAFVDATFGAEFFVHREPPVQIPNGVVSRFPILEAGEWDDTLSTNRELVYVRVDVPGAVDLWADSVHLLTANATTRANEVDELLGYIATFVPPGDLFVVGGDFNTDNEGEPALDALDAIFSFDHAPADQDGVRGTNASRSKRFDWVLPDDDLEFLQFAVIIGEQAFPDGLVVDTRVYLPIADLAPALVDDSAGPSMQHMAVVRDFYLPTD